MSGETLVADVGRLVGRRVGGVWVVWVVRRSGS